MGADDLDTIKKRNKLRAELGLPELEPKSIKESLGPIPAWLVAFKDGLPAHDEAYRVHENIRKLTGDEQIANVAYDQVMRGHLVKRKKAR